MEPVLPLKVHTMRPSPTSTEDENTCNISPMPSTLLSAAQVAVDSTLPLEPHGLSSDHDDSVSAMYAASDIAPIEQTLQDPSSTSCFLSLPKELRDHIVSLALLSGPIRLSRGGIAVEIEHNNFEASTTPLCSVSAKNGLPTWMLSSKQILHDALDIIARTFKFRLSSSPEAYRHRKRTLVASNPLVFSQGRIHNILISSTLLVGYHPHPRDHITIHDGLMSTYLRDFVLVMKEMAADRISLEVDWSIASPRGSCISSIYAIPWLKFWKGKVRQVKIKMTVSPRLVHTNDFSLLLQHARNLAEELAGVDSREISTEVIDDKDIRMTCSEPNKKIVVERTV